MKKNIANIISVSRIILTILFVACKEKTALFLIFYGLSALSDVADGYIARKLQIESKFGSRLDSIADMVMYLSVAWVTISWFPGMKQDLLRVVLFIAVLRLVNVVVGFWRFKKLTMLHTFANKASGLFLTALPLFSYHRSTIFLCVTGIMCALSAMEESALLFIIKKDDLNVKSIFRLESQ